MSARANLQKAKRYIVTANFASAVIMIITFFVLKKMNPDGENYWILLAGIVFALAGILFSVFVRRLEKRFDQADIR